MDRREDCVAPLTHCACPRETVCALDLPSLLLLGVARVGAYFDYALYMLLFVSKCNHLATFFERTFWGTFVPFHDLHEVHTAAGAIVGVECLVHSACHTARWALQGRLDLLYSHVTGRSGAIAALVTPLIVWPMLFPSIKRRVAFEWRKAAHMLSVVWCAALLFHAPTQHIAKLLGAPLLLYALDYLYGITFRTYRVKNTLFTRLECGTELVFENPEGFTSHGSAGYILLNIPWVNRFQFHAFSLFPHPTLPNHSAVCILRAGDWTTALWRELDRPTTRPCFVSGPFASSYATAMHFDKLFLVATGIGITPALSVINHYHDTDRYINLVWSCRERSLVEFYLRVGRFDPYAWTVISYTGKEPLRLDALRRAGKLPPTLLVVTGRPDFEKIFKNVVAGIETGEGLPARMRERYGGVAGEGAAARRLGGAGRARRAPGV
eukprot:PRCOL_00003634-RA